MYDEGGHGTRTGWYGSRSAATATGERSEPQETRRRRRRSLVDPEAQRREPWSLEGTQWKEGGRLNAGRPAHRLGGNGRFCVRFFGCLCTGKRSAAVRFQGDDSESVQHVAEARVTLVGGVRERRPRRVSDHQIGIPSIGVAAVRCAARSAGFQTGARRQPSLRFSSLKLWGRTGTHYSHYIDRLLDAALAEQRGSPTRSQHSLRQGRPSLRSARRARMFAGREPVPLPWLQST